MKLDLTKALAAASRTQPSIQLKPIARILPNDDSAKSIIEAEVNQIDAKIRSEDAVTDGRIATQAMVLPSIDPTLSPRLSRLIDDDFTFDDSQLLAINGLSHYQFACMTGAAGTGKTTCLKKVVDEIQDQLPAINMANYWKRIPDPGTKAYDDYMDALAAEQGGDDEYVTPEHVIPGVALVAYTGRASQMIKKNFPRDWHSNIMTIHRLLGFYPEWQDKPDPQTGIIRKVPVFVPLYNSSFKLPFKVIIIDEAGMLGLDLWHQLLAACEHDTRIIMVGDINQLPPTHGKSVFGFAMSKWPAWELTHIHRQKGANNSIVDAAWSVINGSYPKSDAQSDPNWKFVTMEINSDPRVASKQLRKWLNTIRGPLYDPIRDAVVTPINGYKDSGGGEQLGQDLLNRELAIMFNQEHGRYIIDAGRDRKYLAVGDKVMATKNDHDIGVTNGMTGIIIDILPNGAYMGNSARFGLIDEVNQYLRDGVIDEEVPENEISLEDIAGYVDEEKESKEKDKKERGPSSHIVTVQFGTEESPLVVKFSTLAEVDSLMMAYVMTCHKLQGGEAPVVIVIVHQSHKKMLYREWLYTAITRASERCIILFTRMGMSAAVNKQNIKGKNLAEKVESFNRLIDPRGLFGASMLVKLPDLPTDQQELFLRGKQLIERPSSIGEADGTPLAGKTTPEPEREPEPIQRVTRVIERIRIVEVEAKPLPPTVRKPIVLTPEKTKEEIQKDRDKRIAEALKQIAPPNLLPIAVSGVRTLSQASRRDVKVMQLEYKPEAAKPEPAKAMLVGGKLNLLNLGRK